MEAVNTQNKKLTSERPKHAKTNNVILDLKTKR